MRPSKQITFIHLFFFLLSGNLCHGQSDQTESKLSEFSWLAGSWIGDGFGGISEEMWSEPTVGSIIGTYKHYNDGKVVFYEFMAITEVEGKISLKLKHFNPDITGWEEKDDFVEFPFVQSSKNKIEFKGLVYELMSENEMEVRLKMRRKGEIVTEVFHFKRK
ncbi:MAG: hypothetical protein JXQ96_05140 [Cyclobacteriaceae bacterium]